MATKTGCVPPVRQLISVSACQRKSNDNIGGGGCREVGNELATALGNTSECHFGAIRRRIGSLREPFESKAAIVAVE